MEKINIAELLKDCHQGMELDCLLFKDTPVYFNRILNNYHYPIEIKVEYPDGSFEKFELSKEGCIYDRIIAKCVIFPKGKTTWEGFVPPCQFKVGDWITNGDYTWKVISVDNLDYTLQNQLGESVYDTIDYVNKAFHLWTINDAKDGDVLFHSDSASNGIFIFNKILQRGTIQKVICYCDYDSEDGFCLGENHTCCWTDSKFLHPATKEQRDILFQKIKEAGYEWVSETKTLEKLPKFKVGDRIKKVKDYISGIITNISDDGSYKVEYQGGEISYVSLAYQDEWELVPNKFDIANLKPFDKVLVRDNDTQEWVISLFSHCNGLEHYKYSCINNTGYAQCVPYEDNKHLLGKTDNCDEFYKTWV